MVIPYLLLLPPNLKYRLIISYLDLQSLYRLFSINREFYLRRKDPSTWCYLLETHFISSRHYRGIYPQEFFILLGSQRESNVIQPLLRPIANKYSLIYIGSDLTYWYRVGYDKTIVKINYNLECLTINIKGSRFLVSIQKKNPRWRQNLIRSVLTLLNSIFDLQSFVSSSTILIDRFREIIKPFIKRWTLKEDIFGPNLWITLHTGKIETTYRGGGWTLTLTI